jgi:mevalonate kinase
LGELILELDTLSVQSPFKFVLQTILYFKEQIPSGFILNINSDFSSIIGFGSSAAVTVATVAVIMQWLELSTTQDEIFSIAKKIMLQVQGVGSGADIAASVYGGVLCYDTTSLTVKLPSIPVLTVVYSGYKTPTSEVIKIVQTAQAQHPQKFSQIFDRMQDCVTKAITAIRDADWSLLGKLFVAHHNLQAELGTSDAQLEKIVHYLLMQPQIYGAKISGSGLGDCVIGLGEVPEQLHINIDQQGLTYAIN